MALATVELEFAESLRALTEGEISAVETVISGFDSQIGPLEETIKSFTITKNKFNFIELNGESVGKVHRVLRSGDLEEVLKLSKRNIPYTSEDVTAFAKVMVDTPEKGVRDIEKLAVANKSKLPQLDLNVEAIDSVSGTSKLQLDRVQSNLLKAFKVGTTVTLTFGAIYVTADWIKKALEERKGCHLLTTINGKTTSCKINSFSCIGSGGVSCSSTPTYRNITLNLMYIANLPNSDALKINVATAVGFSADKLRDKLTEIIDTKFKEASTVIRNETIPSFEPCSVTHPDIDNGKVPPCRMCSTSALPTSTQYIDPKDLATNVALQCVTNPSVLDVVADTFVNTGKNLLEGIAGGLTTLLRPLLIAAAIIAVVVIIIAIVLNYMRSRNNDKEGGSKVIVTQAQRQPPQPSSTRQAVRV
jgi:hypothetical protein